MNRRDIIYLDNAASTPVLPEVIDVMIPYLGDHYGNPSSQHLLGFKSSKAIEEARKQVASLVGSSPDKITFTSGGTEANNMAIKSLISNWGSSNNSESIVLVSSTIEHDSVLESFNYLKDLGFKIKFVAVNREGIIEPQFLQEILANEKVALISIMLANNEVGTIQPIKELAKIIHQNSNALIHCDAVQALGKIPIDVNHLEIDFLSLSSHKIYGPKGIGALYARDKHRLKPLIDGGGQEKSFRSGTENVHGVVGFGKACEIAYKHMSENYDKVKKLRDLLIDQVTSMIPHCYVNGSLNERLSNNAHFSFPGVKGEDIILKLNEHGIAASTGSACSSNKNKASHVLEAMGKSFPEIEGSLRLTLGHQNTKFEVDRVVVVLEQIIKHLRRFSGFSNYQVIRN
jgi:cysteine desulfurase